MVSFRYRKLDAVACPAPFDEPVTTRNRINLKYSHSERGEGMNQTTPKKSIKKQEESTRRGRGGEGINGWTNETRSRQNPETSPDLIDSNHLGLNNDDGND